MIAAIWAVLNHPLSWIAATLGLGALVAAYFSKTVRELLPSPRRLARLLQRV